MLSLVCSVIFGMLSACSVSYSMLAVTRTLTGVALSGVSLIILPLGKYGELMGVQGAYFFRRAVGQWHRQPGRWWSHRPWRCSRTKAGKGKNMKIKSLKARQI